MLKHSCRRRYLYASAKSQGALIKFLPKTVTVSHTKKTLAIYARAPPTLEVFGDLLVPEGYIALAIVDNGTEDGFASEVSHEVLHALDAVNEVDHLIFVRLLVERADSVVHRLTEDGRQTDAHRGMCERVLMVAAVRRPGRVVGVDLSTLAATRHVSVSNCIGGTMHIVRFEHTREGVRGHTPLTSFLLGRWPRWRVTLVGAPERVGEMPRPALPPLTLSAAICFTGGAGLWAAKGSASPSD